MFSQKSGSKFRADSSKPFFRISTSAASPASPASASPEIPEARREKTSNCQGRRRRQTEGELQRAATKAPETKGDQPEVKAPKKPWRFLESDEWMN